MPPVVQATAAGHSQSVADAATSFQSRPNELARRSDSITPDVRDDDDGLATQTSFTSSISAVVPTAGTQTNELQSSATLVEPSVAASSSRSLTTPLDAHTSVSSRAAVHMLGLSRDAGLLMAAMSRRAQFETRLSTLSDSSTPVNADASSHGPLVHTGARITFDDAAKLLPEQRYASQGNDGGRALQRQWATTIEPPTVRGKYDVADPYNGQIPNQRGSQCEAPTSSYDVFKCDV